MRGGKCNRMVIDKNSGFIRTPSLYKKRKNKKIQKI